MDFADTTPVVAPMITSGDVVHIMEQATRAALEAGQPLADHVQDAFEEYVRLNSHISKPLEDELWGHLGTLGFVF